MVISSPGVDGQPRRSHVTRHINETEAAVVRRIFEMARDGVGKALIAKTLNAEGAPSPRAQQGRPNAWSPSSVYEVLFRPLYRGELVYNRTAKRDSWGRKRQSARPAADWIRTEAPALRIVADELWAAAHARLDRSRAVYLEQTRGRAWGRPPSGSDAKYLLTGLAECPECGGTLMVETREHGRRRKPFYTCNNHRRRGPTVCGSRHWIDLEAADRAVLDAVSTDVLRTDVVNAAIDRALDRLLSARLNREEERARLSARLETTETELTRLTDALATGVGLASIAEALSSRETERVGLRGELAALDAIPTLDAGDRARIRGELAELLDDWRGLLTQHVAQARQILRKLLTRRVRFIPETHDGVQGYRLEGQGTLRPLMEAFIPHVASGTGTDAMYVKESLVQEVASPTNAWSNRLRAFLVAWHAHQTAA